MKPSKYAMVGLAYILSQGLILANDGPSGSLSTAPEFQKRITEKSNIGIATNCLQTTRTRIDAPGECVRSKASICERS